MQLGCAMDLQFPGKESVDGFMASHSFRGFPSGFIFAMHCKQEIPAIWLDCLHWLKLILKICVLARQTIGRPVTTPTKRHSYGFSLSTPHPGKYVWGSPSSITTHLQMLQLQSLRDTQVNYLHQESWQTPAGGHKSPNDVHHFGSLIKTPRHMGLPPRIKQSRGPGLSPASSRKTPGLTPILSPHPPALDPPAPAQAPSRRAGSRRSFGWPDLSNSGPDRSTG